MILDSELCDKYNGFKIMSTDTCLLMPTKNIEPIFNIEPLRVVSSRWLELACKK